MLILLACSASAVEAADLDLTSLSQQAGFDVRSVAEGLMSGRFTLDADAIRQAVQRLGISVKDGLLEVLKALAAPVLAGLLLKTVLGDTGGMLGLLCRVSCAVLLMGRYLQAQSVCQSALQATVKLVNAASPVLVTALTLTGAAERATVLTPSTALCANLIEGLLLDGALPMCDVAAALAASANLSDRFQLNRLFSTVTRWLGWGLGLLLSGFVGLMALQGLLVRGQDAVSVRAIQRALRSMIPIVGGEVSDSAGALLASALSVRNLAGVAGMVAAVGSTLAPILRLVVSTLSLKLAAAVLEPVADAGVAWIIASYGALHKLLLAICVSGTLLAVLLLGACLSLTGG